MLYVRDKASLLLSQRIVKIEKGGRAVLELNVTNVGEAKAEYVDVRVLKQSSQPFTFDSRSQYLGMLSPGESSIVSFDVSAKREAQEREYLFDVILRAKGDSEQGDTTIYTYSRKAKVEVEGQATNPLLYVGAGIAIIALILFFWRKKK